MVTLSNHETFEFKIEIDDEKDMVDVLTLLKKKRAQRQGMEGTFEPILELTFGRTLR